MPTKTEPKFKKPGMKRRPIHTAHPRDLVRVGQTVILLVAQPSAVPYLELRGAVMWVDREPGVMVGVDFYAIQNSRDGVENKIEGDGRMNFALELFAGSNRQGDSWVLQAKIQLPRLLKLG